MAGREDPKRAPALAGNFAGGSLILVSLWRDWNLSAAVVEGAWAAIALVRIALRLDGAEPGRS